ncbi:putative HTH-type transcriptional regulator YugG [Clostridia bacterium]|nr:putative HTH-type transcriptional regulator YugG [Clostridia bacterium]
MQENFRNKIAGIIRNNARLTDGEIAAALGVSAAEVAAEIEGLENEGLIAGYAAIIDEEKLNKNSATAMIELKVSPQAGVGYTELARKIANYREVEAVVLFSGAFDLAVTVRAEDFREITMFVSERLAPLDGVLSTTTHFVLERFKEKNFLFSAEEYDERGFVSP